MPAVNFKLRWPDGQEMSGYSPSTVIYEHLSSGTSYALEDFILRAENALNAASERVREVKGFYCSSAMDTLGALRYHARRYEGGNVHILDMQTAHAGQVNSGWSSF
ncbi:NAD/NADP transhydrogenase alpha subunit [Stutzerimonas stutzeri]|uniref:NAD/NADP transhydrogenase alpha subunit n=1 Tax=Stutzerimonas stutzeri TaxID=316 RepID=A0A2N8SXM9_STUST|nr:MSMEG_0570 family nitrogen starvation response protein [Stutzerimonas stutzeri]MCQ4325560.1 MSMEG_0570 family nitrogen starvation response protein [Stutzerimonas stutzeri]PNG07243.1 NAD/NADP transhydrogenase alpha subunit [Stutzerimonas stutzeri]